VGLTERGQRRVPGLRREEVAMLAGVSVDYYTRLEQGRSISPSDAVLDSLATALRLTPAQRTHLYILARDYAPLPTHPADDSVPASAPSLLAALTIPAIVVGRGTAVIAANRLHRALTTDFFRREPRQRFFAHWLFTDAAARDLLVDWEHSARESAGILRTSFTRFPADQRLHTLVEELTAASEPFRAFWNEHDVQDPSPGQKRYRHPVVGELTLTHEVARLPDGQWMRLYWPEPGSQSERALDLLRSRS
jgi:transcriptional regulator with XRE-family HTH domain